METAVNTEQQVNVKPRKKKKGLKVFLCILAAFAVFVCITVVVSVIGNQANLKKACSFASVEYGEDRLVPEVDADGFYFFTADRDVKVLQLTDIHIGGGWLSLKKDAMALNAVAAMVAAEKPDLVIVTGDVSFPVFYKAGTFNNKSAAKLFAGLMEHLGVYWTVAFGNHDTELYTYFSREKMSAFYSSDKYSYCLFQAGPDDVDGYGNQVIRIKNGEGLITQSLYLLDSHSYTDGDFLGILWKYDNIHRNQIDWYAAMVAEDTAANRKIDPEAGVVSSTLFFHIPLEEYKDAWKEYVDNGFQDTENVKYYFGTAGETGRVIYSGMGEDEVFETVQALGSTKAIFCGHDHYNNFSLDYKGIRLTYGKSIDYLAYDGIYKQGAQRGCTVITYSPDGSFDCASESYYQEKYQGYYAKEAVTMQDVEPVTVFED
ncbi:MAG: metallophosphoesterase [Clostridia bacterium]|nr:metallophosphoesterase [Clostridia bacterium]